jgi:hypothetical protein
VQVTNLYGFSRDVSQHRICPVLDGSVITYYKHVQSLAGVCHRVNGENPKMQLVIKELSCLEGLTIHAIIPKEVL